WVVGRPAASVQREVCPQRAGEQGRVLRQVSDEPSPFLWCGLREGTAIDEHRSCLDWMDPQDRPRQRTLAGADGPGDADQRPGWDVEVQPPQRWTLGARVPEGQAA